MKKIAWVQRLGFAACVCCFERAVLSGTDTYYDESRVTPAAKRFLALLERCGLAGHFHPLELKGDKKDAAGRTLFYKIYAEMEAFMEKFRHTFIPHEPKWFEHMAASYMLDWLSSPFYFMVMIGDAIAKRPDEGHTVYISGYPIGPLIVKFTGGRGDGYRIKASFGLRERLMPFLSPIYLICRTLVFQLVSPRARTDIRTVRPAVWVEYEGVKTLLSFWRTSVEPDAFDLVYCIDRDDLSPSPEAREKCRRDGFKWIDNRKIRLARFNVEDMADIITSLFSRAKNDPLWLHFFKLSYTVVFRMYRSIFKRYQVKVFIQHHDTLWRTQAQVRALEAAGGIVIGFHWSYLQVSHPFYLTPEHVYFVWGKHMYDYLQRKGHTCRHILPCGLWVVKNESGDLRKELADDVDFVMAFVDASVARNAYQTPDTLSRFYRFAVGLLERNKTWGGIVKCKSSGIEEIGHLPEGEAIVARMKKLVSEKRLLFLSYVVSPITASSYADLTVTYALQTAGIIAGTHGHPVVIWDVAGWLKESLYRDRAQRIIFSSLEDLEKAIIAVSRGDRTIGDFSDKRLWFNHFGDLRAQRRVGGFIQTFMNEILSTTDASLSLERSARLYREEHKIDDEFFSTNLLWNDTEAIHAR